MLFINFLCLFYLMVLVTSHTISKSIATTESFDGIDDSFNDLDLKRNRRAKHDRIHPRHETLWNKSPETRSITEIILEGDGTEKHGRKAARNLQGIWKKYHNRKAKNKSIPEVQIEPHYNKLFNNLGTEASYNNLVEYVTNSYLKPAKEARPKKHAKGKRKNFRDYDALLNIEDNLEKPPMKHRRCLRRPAMRHSTRRYSKKFQDDQSNNITNILGSMSTKLDQLKRLYSKAQYTSLDDVTEPVMKNKKKAKFKSVNLFDVPDAFKSTASIDSYEGTAAIEAILNEVKCRAIDMIASHRPSVSDLITNAVTETTYSVDPLLKHMNVINPLIAVSTLVTINELPNKVTARAMKKEVTDNNLGYYIFQTEPTRKARCAKTKLAVTDNDDANVQSRLKTIFQKVREDLNNIRAENKKIQETLKMTNKSAVYTLAAGIDSPTTASSKDPDDEAPNELSSYHDAVSTLKENVPSRHKNQEPITLPTIDASMFEDNDYDMLSVYEHILAKTQESNMMKFLSTKLHPSMKRKGRQAFPYRLRKKISIDPDEPFPDNSFDEISTEAPIEETSFEALTQKLAYNDFVNGYKHYLKFEKDMAQSNFSNLVRYQAHKHHAVDEIGKYILDKIPQIPPAMQDRFKRNFFDYYDDDQDISTQHDDSWIKKYFNYFVEHSATPKKYHTSQTVPMKAPVEEKNHTTERIEHKDFLKNHVLLRTHTVDMDLDQLTHMIRQDTSTSVPIPCAYSFPSKLSSSSFTHTKVGLDRKDLLKNHDLDQLTRIIEQEKSTSILLPIAVRQKQRNTPCKKEHFNQNLIAIKNALHSPHIVDKFFSEIGRSAKKFTNKKYSNDNTEEAVVEDSNRSRSRRQEFIEEDQLDQESFDEKEAIQLPKPKVLASLLGNAPTEEKAKGKVGYANIDVVPAAPKGKIERKKSRFMTWLNKWKWHKKKAKPKREAERVPRFNIVKKLKQLFDGKPDKLGLSDYDLATTELEGFNPLKYDSSQHIHDIQKQLPEISDDRKLVSPAVSIAKYPPYMSHHNIKKPAKKKPHPRKHEKKYQTLISSNLENFNDGMNFFNPTSTQPVDSAKIQQIKHEIDNIDLKLSSTSTRTKLGNIQSQTSLYNLEADFMNNEDLESLGRSESDNVNINPLTEHPSHLESKEPGEKSKTILTRDAKSHYSQSRNYDDYNQGGHVGAEVEMGDYMKKRESSIQNETDRIRAINNISHKIDTTPDTTVTTTSYEDTIDDFDDLIIWNNNILDSDSSWSGAMKKMGMQAQENPLNMTNQFADFMNSTRASKNQSDDDIGEISTDLRNTAAKYSKQFVKTTSVTPNRIINHSSEKKQQQQLRNFLLDDDRIVTSEVMLKRLNSLNSILGRPEERLKNIYVKKNNKPGIVENMSDRDTSVDSTIFAYDDGYGFFTDENRKLSKNQVDIGNSTTSLTTITPPPQHYTTPLPMTPQQFDKFLKYNELDVQTVTSPIPETPDMLGSWAHKQEEHAKTEPYDEVELKRKLHIPLSLPKNLSNLNNELKSRNQVSRMIPDESEMIWPNLEFNYRDLKQSFKRKLKFNKPDERNVWLGKTFSASTKGEKQIELTLINFDSEDVTQGSDFDLNYYDSPYHKEEHTEATKAPTKPTKPKTTEDSDIMRTEKVSEDRVKPTAGLSTTKATQAKLSDMDARVALKILHNQLMYNNSLHQKLKTSTDVTRDILRFSHLHKQPKKGPTPEPEGFQITLHPPQPTYKVTTKLTSQRTTTTTNDPLYYTTDSTDQMIYTTTSTPPDFLKTLKLVDHVKPQKVPKRIQIHSHSYKYNIEYQDEVPQLDSDKGFSALIINQLLKQNAAKKKKQHGFKTPHSDFKSQVHQSSGTKINQFMKTLELSQVMLSTTTAPTSKKTQITMGSADWDDYMSYTKRQIARQRQKRFTWHLPSNLLAKSSSPALNTMSVIVTSAMTTDKGKVEEKRNEEEDDNLREPLQSSASETTEMVLTIVTPKFLNNLIRHLHEKAMKHNNSGVFVSDNCRIFTKGGKVFIETPKSFEVGQMYQNDTELASKKEETEETNIKIDKRESNDFYTAKDVAALEVIIDLIKNTVSEEEAPTVTVTPSMIHSISEFAQTYSPTYSLSPPEFPITNSIQVHIALPNYLENEINNKRSLDRLRKVFSAKMYTPVDLEYQIHSFDESPETTTVATTTMLPPGMYLLVENCNNASLPRGSFILKPISHSINIANLSLSGIKVRQAEVHTENTHTEKVTTTANDKLSKVTLSKDFVAAINKHLMQLYESLHTNNESERKNTRNTDIKVNATKRTRRGLNWKNIKNYFQTSKYCDCKPNRTMCRACAASDAVMGELIFELNNLVKYMNDHCVEIQTYFRSNPSGGRKLREAVRKVDQSLDSYYKKVKGKCKVKTCCETYTCIHKRELVNATAAAPESHKTNNYMKLADDIESFAHDINNASKLNICFNDALKKGTYKLFGVVAKCTNQSNNSRANKHKSSREKEKYKNVYSLDNVNVNIICNNDSNKQLAASNQDMNREGQHLLDYFAEDSENNNNNNEKKRKWFFRNIFRRKENTRAYPKLDKYKKREVQIDNPLNADTGGSFWSDYIHKIQTDRPRLVRETNKREAEMATSSLQGNISSLSIDPVSVTVTYMSTTAEKNMKVTPVEIIQTKSLTIGGEATEKAAEESLNYNINELFRLLGNVYIADRNETTFNTGATSNVTSQTFTKGMTTLKPSDWYNCKKKKNKGKCKVCKKNKCKCANKKKTTKNTTKRADITSLAVKTKTKTKPKTKTTKTTTKSLMSSMPTKSLVDLGVVNSTGTWVGIPANSVAAPAGVTQIMDTINKIKNSTLAYVNSYYGQRVTSKVTVKTTTVTKDQNQISRLLHMLGARSFSDKNKEDNSVMNTEIEITSDENPTILIINDDDLSDDSTEESTNATQTTKKITSAKETNAAQVTKLISEQPEMIPDQTEKTTNSTQSESETPSQVTISAQTSNTTNLRQRSKVTTVNQTSNTTNITETTEAAATESMEESASTDEAEKSTEEPKTEDTSSKSDDDARGGDEDIAEGRTENVVKSLLLSVLKFETKRLDSEYERLLGRSADDNVVPRAAAARPTDDIINVRIKILNVTALTTRATSTSTPTSTTTTLAPVRAEYDLPRPIYDLAHDLPLAHKMGPENIVNKFLHKFVVKTRKEEPSVEVRLHSARGQMLHSTLQSSVIKEKTGDDSDSEGIISAALILRDRKEEGVTARAPAVSVQFQSPAFSKVTRSFVVVKETCDTPAQICDLQDTFAHLLYCQQQMKTEYYVKFLKTMICYKFIDGPDYFFIKSKSNKFFCFSKDEVIDKVKGKKKFDWIRSKRSAVSNDAANGKVYSEFEVSDDLGEAKEGKDRSAAYSLLADSAPNDGFEMMIKDKYGIYRSVERARRKRTSTDRIGEELRNLPPIDIPKNVIYAIEGETVTLTCIPKMDCPGRLTWWVDTPHAQDNVMVDGEQLVITGVKPANVANYSCGQGNMVLNTTGVRVVSLPIYDVITTPLYTCSRHCSDHELKVMHELGPQMTDVGCLSQSCTIKIDRPRCLTDLASNVSLLSVRSTMRLPRRAPPCGIECARDAHGSWAVVAATSAPLLAKIKVVVERDNTNITLTPTTDSHRRLVLSMTLTDDPNIINQAPFAVVPGDIEVVVSCPPDYVLVAKLRICMATLPAIDRSYTGRSRRLHRYDWWQWPAWCVVVGGVLAVGGACAAVRRGERRRATRNNNTQLMFHRVSAAASSVSGPAPAPRRRISPSRVILPRLFRHASSRISQETKLGSTKKHHAPPLPPIDFDS